PNPERENTLSGFFLQCVWGRLGWCGWCCTSEMGQGNARVCMWWMFGVCHVWCGVFAAGSGGWMRCIVGVSSSLFSFRPCRRSPARILGPGSFLLVSKGGGTNPGATVMPVESECVNPL